MCFDALWSATWYLKRRAFCLDWLRIQITAIRSWGINLTFRFFLFVLSPFNDTMLHWPIPREEDLLIR